MRLITYYVNAPAVAGGSGDKALEQAREIRKRETARGHLALARVYQSQEDDEATEREYRAAIKAAPDEMNTYLSLEIFLTSLERFSDAMSIYDRALDISPDDMAITYQVGRTASISGNMPQRGIEAFTSYLDYTPRPNEPGTHRV